MTNDDEFYIGYEPALPPGMRRRVRGAVASIIALVFAVGVMVVLTARPLARSSFAFGETEWFQGYLVREPAPALLVPASEGFERVWLVGRGKRGAHAALGGLRDGWVTVRGSVIERDPWRMVEVASVELAPTPDSAPLPPAGRPDPGRPVSVRGEIVDSKCFLGVMNPGERTVHRDCAIRCLSGGVMPMVSFVDAEGRADLAVLVREDGLASAAELRPFVGRPVTLSGRLYSIEGTPVLQLASVSGGPS